MLNVEVVYAKSDDYQIVSLTVPLGTTIEHVIEQSGIQSHYPEIDLTVHRVGVFGELKALTDTVSEGDRIEIYRPIEVDPMQRRNQRVRELRQIRQRQRQAKYRS